MQHDQTIENGTGAAVRADINNALAAIFGVSSGPSAPSTTIARQLWADETNGLYKRRNAANSGWLPALPGSSAMWQSKTSAYTIAPGDFGTLIDCSGSFTLSMTAAATLGDGWWCAVRNSGSSPITIDPNGTETIDNATTLILGPGDSVVLFCNGSNFRTYAGRQGLRGALMLRNSDLALTSGATTAIAWGTAVYDTEGIWSAGAATRLTVPVGVSLVRLHAQLHFDVNANGDRLVDVIKNGATFDGMPAQGSRAPASLEGRVSVTSGPIPVVAGDYFECRASQNSGGALNLRASSMTWFGMEIIR